VKDPLIPSSGVTRGRPGLYALPYKIEQIFFIGGPILLTGAQISCYATDA